MDNINNIEKIEKYQTLIKDLFREQADPVLYEKWSDTFEVEVVNDKQVMIVYHGAEDIKKFRKECCDILKICVYTIMSFWVEIKIIRKNGFNSLSPRAKKNIKAAKFFVIGMMCVFISMAVILVMGNYIGNRSFRETFYSVSSIKVDSRVRVIQLSDLHGSSYGKDNARLLERVAALKPDVIICTGDMVDSIAEDTEYAVSLAKSLAEIAPAYYIYGNRENAEVYNCIMTEQALDEKFGFDAAHRDGNVLREYGDSFEEILEEAGMKVLKNEKDTIEVENMKIDVYGVLTSNPSSFWSYSEDAFMDYLNENPSNLKITAVHEPFIFEEFQPDSWGDLMVAGHTHGGVIRVPLLGPLFTAEGGIFPERSGKYVYGRYSAAGRPLIVSSGLENSNVFRVNNQPELVIIDINKF